MGVAMNFQMSVGGGTAARRRPDHYEQAINLVATASVGLL